MDSFLLQDWITINNKEGPGPLAQSSGCWLDTAEYEDLFFFLQVSQVGAVVPTITYQTAPTKEEGYFVAMTLPVSMNVGTQTTAAIGAYAQTPAARYVRWQLSATSSAYSVTFRVFVAGYSLA